jgi:hypothetical protein
MKFDERNDFFLDSPRFISMATAGKFFLPIAIFLAYLVPVDVDATGNITAKNCEAWSECKIVCTLVAMATAAILNFCNPLKSCHTLQWIFLQGSMKFDERNPNICSWQLRQSLSNRFRFVWLISFH